MSAASAAIDRSISHNEIVTIEHNIDAAEELGLVCADSVVNGRVIEFWGTDDSGENEWRVHMATEPRDDGPEGGFPGHSEDA